jgi:hypothetical protein
VLSGLPSGLYAFTAVLVYLVARFIVPFVEVRSAAGFAPLAAAVGVVHGLIVWALVALTSAEGVDRSAMLGAVLPGALLTLVAALLMWPLLRWIENRFRKPETGLLP